jgi:hypothetical protein
MKRAWPYALALAVVVTGCYLALAPLLRSLSPAPASTANRLSQGSNVQTVGKSKSISIKSTKPGTNSFVSALATKKKAKKVKKSTTTTTRKSTTTTNAPSQSTSTTGFANNAPSSSSSNTTAQAPKSTVTTPKSTASPPKSKAASKKTGSASVGGGIDQSQGSGFAGPTGSGSVVGGQTLAPGN